MTVAAPGVYLQGVDIAGRLRIRSTSGVSVLQSSVSGGIVVDGGSAVWLADSAVSGADALTLTGNTSDAVVEYNTIEGQTGGIVIGDTRGGTLRTTTSRRTKSPCG